MVVILELRISGTKTDDFIRKNGVDKSHRVEAISFSRGISLLWKGCFDVEIVLNHKQFIHFKIMQNGRLVSWVTAVYPSPASCNTRLLWDNLGKFASNM